VGASAYADALRAFAREILWFKEEVYDLVLINAQISTSAGTAA